MMIRFAGLVYPGYNIYRRTGLSEGMPISNQTAAQLIVADMIQDGYFVDFVEALIQIDAKGYMGRRYNLKGLKDVVAGLVHDGYYFDPASGQFFENQRERTSPNWGRLQEGDERKMTVLRLDIAGNSRLVRQNPRDKIERAYKDLRLIITKAVTSRFGRLWAWEGDGALAAFLFGSMEKAAVYCGMEILHELFFYNVLRNPLDSPINVRIGAHLGTVRYSDDETERLKNDTVKQAGELESLAAVNSMGVSYNLFITMDQNTLNLFTQEKNSARGKYRLYTIGLEKP
jgi:class 3 adenylate cyclase